ncbi:apolipoprotein B-100 [Alligator mississippiensis]|uniref:Apolipoprotein B-100 n=1 Tax=Alligator mississippiensis TaxID=8496 RepID=A0A151PIT1_ALLMI|nr:apolipoprotein B-100 [Alligator mississippiensis]
MEEEEGPENGSPSCSKEATRFKHLRKYIYTYEAETASGVSGTADSRTGSKMNCKVELEVPQLCSFILKTSQCTLREVFGTDAEGKAMLKKSKNSDDFASAMSQHELKFNMQDGTKVQLYPEKHESVNILNIKRGIISALLVPMETEDKTKIVPMDTVYGKCDTEVEVRTRKGSIATDISMNRNLKTCDNFNPVREHVSPIALIKGLDSPLSTLIKSTQYCQYSIDTKRRHVSEVVCSEKHLFLPSSYKNRYGIMTQVTQTLKLEDTPKSNSRTFDEAALEKRGLSLENSNAKSSKFGDSVLKTLEELQKLSSSQNNQQRPRLFYRFVSGLRSLHNDTLGSLVPKMIETSSSITIQALTQCGTVECYSAILQILRSGHVNPLVADIVTYTLGLVPSPCPKRLREILNMAQHLRSRASFYALSHTVNGFYRERNVITEEVKDVAKFMESLLGNECSGDNELAYLTLRAIGNMGSVLEEAHPSLKSAVRTCIRSEAATLSVQKSAIQALRKMTLTEEDRAVLLTIFQEADAPVEKRLAAYLMIMKNPSQSDLVKIVKTVSKDKNEQVKSFISSHITNILDSEEIGIEFLKNKLQEAFKGFQIPTAWDFKKFSRNYQISKNVSLPGNNSFSARVEGNLLFEPNNAVPKETMLKTTLQVYGFSPMDIFEIGLDGKNFEPTLEALFGHQGFFPDSTSKALYWIDGRVPEQVSKMLFDYFGYTRKNTQEQELMTGLARNLEKLIKEVGNKDFPEARAYLQILGEELGYMKLNDFKLLGNMLLKTIKTLPSIPEKIVQAISKGTEADLFVHYMFMDNEFELPTGAGFQLQVALSGIMTPGAKAGMKMHYQKHMHAELIAKPSVGIEFISHVGINIPVFARSGVQMNSIIYHESGFEAHIGTKTGQLKFSIPAPKTPTKLFSISNTLHLVSPTKTEVIPPLIENRESRTSCKPLFTGLNYCTKVEYSNSSTTEAAPYYPLTGETSFEVEIQPTGERILTSAVQIPNFDVDFGTNFRVNDESTPERKAYTFILDLNNKKIPEVTLTGRVRYDGKEDAMLGGDISIPRLQTQLTTETLLHFSANSASLQINSAATAHGNSISESIVFKYNSEKVELEWHIDTNAAVKQMSSSFPVDLAEYPKTLRKHANELLDRKVAQTDMTLRHIVSQFIVATNTWLQKASRDVPYAQTLKNKLSGLQELNFQKMGLPVITIPEELFLKSDGRIKYIWNKDSIIINIPLPFGGRSSHDIKIPKSVKTPPLVMQSVGLNVPSKEFRIPPFTIPESYPLHVPLLGTLDISTNLYSNYFNWSAAYKLANTTKTIPSMKTNYHMTADSVFELLSFNVQGNGEISSDNHMFTYTHENSLEHILLSSKFKFSKTKKYEPTFSSKDTISLQASSTLGAQLSFVSDMDFKQDSSVGTSNMKMEGQVQVASVFARSTYTLTSTYNENSHELVGESNLNLDSSYLQASNQMTGRYSNDVFLINSVTDVQSGIFRNTASLKYEKSHLKVISETNGRYQNLAGLNKFELTLAKRGAALRSEFQTTYRQNRYYTLLTSSLDSQGFVLNTDVSVNDQRNRAAHKSSLTINQDGLASSATTNLQFSPLMLQNEMNARLGTSGGSLMVSSSGRYGKHNGKFSIDGRVALMEIALGSVYQSTVLGVDSKNIFNFRVNREGLKFSNNLLGSYKEMKLEHVNELNIPGFSLAFVSKLDNTVGIDKSHKHSFDLQLQPRSLTAKLSNDIKFNEFDITNKAELRLEPLKLNLGGNVRGAYRTNEVKHTYTITYADLAAGLKTDTLAKVQGTALSHRVNLEIAGLASSITMNTNCDSKHLHFTNVVRSIMAPFTVTTDIHTTGDGSLIAMGEHTGQLYSKFLFKAEPLAFTMSHDYRGSTGHALKSGKKYTTLLDNKIGLLFTPSEQSSTWKLKSQLNNNVYIQELSAYNDAEKTGMELSGKALADLTIMDSPVQVPFVSERINLIDMLGLRDSVEEPQEFSISGSVKYDKNKDMHFINLPFLDRLPVYFEQIKGAVISTLQSMQKYLRSINVDQHMRKYRASLDKLPHRVNDYINKIDLKSRVNRMKQNLVAFTKDYSITADDLQTTLENVITHFQDAVLQLQAYLIKIEQYIRENYDQYDLQTAIAKLIDQIVERMKILDQQYKISVTVINTLQTLQTTIAQYDLSTLGSSTSAWIQNVDDHYKIRVWIQEKLEQLKIQIQNIDAGWIAENLKQQIQAINMKEVLEKIKGSFPVKKMNEIIEQIKEILLNFIEDYEVTEKINAFRGKVHELIVKYKIDKQAYLLMDGLIEMFNQYKVKEFVQKLTISLKKIDIKSLFDKIVSSIDDAVKQVQMLDYKKWVDEINKFFDMVIKKLVSFDYNQFVDDTNNKIREVTQKINDELRALELPQKVEAAKQYIKEVNVVVSQFITQLKDTNLAVIITWFSDLLNSTAFTSLKAKINEHLEDLRERIYEMDITKECQRYLEMASQFYYTVVTYISDKWNIAAEKIALLAEQYNVKHWAENVNQLIETGFRVPEIKTGFINLPSFEVSLRALREATFQTPDFVVPLTDLHISSYQINIKNLKELKIPMRFTTPEFTILNTFKVPSYTIDLIEIKLQIVKTIDQMMAGELYLPTPMYFRDLKMRDMPFSGISFPEIQIPELQIPEMSIPKLNLNDFQIPSVQIPEFQLPRIPHAIAIPAFGKLSSAFRIASPFFTLSTQAGVQNTTASAKSPEFVASVSAQATSKLDFFAFTMNADARLSAPEMEQLNLKETMKFTHRFLKADHKGELVFLGTSVEGKAETTANIRTAKNSIEVHNNLMVKLQKKVSMQSRTSYSHRLNIPQADLSSQAELSNDMTTELEAGHILFTSNGRGNWKWSLSDFSDEGTHESHATFKVEGPLIVFAAENKINDKYLKVNQIVNYECGFLNYAKLQIKSEIESQHVGRSILNVQGKGHLGEMKVELTGSHNAQLNGQITGVINNNIAFLVQPFEIHTSTNNEVNVKVSFPMKLIGKIEYLYNYGLVLSSSVQQISWQAGGRFNQYRYFHNVSAGNDEDKTEAYVGVNGDANLDFLLIPLTVPQFDIPHTGMKTPQLKEYSLWEQTGLKNFLKTTRQSFDLNLKVQYTKNKDMHSIPLPLEAVYDRINKHIISFNKHFEKGRDNVLDFLTRSYNEAKAKLDKYKVEPSLSKLRRTFKIPGYTIPIVNIEVSPFTAELPAFGFLIPKEISTTGFTIPLIGFSVPSYTLVLPSLELPVLHVPQDLRTLKLPNFRMTNPIDHILIPALGNMTCDFSFKSSVITLNSNAGLFNQSDIVAHLSATSLSVIEALQFKLDGTSSLTRKRGLKLASALSLSNNKFVEGNHDSTVSLSKKSVEASLTTNAKINTPVLKMNFRQELTGNTKSKPTVSTVNHLGYAFDMVEYIGKAKGTIDHKFTLESLTSYISLETATKGNIDGLFYPLTPFSGTLIHEANTYLNANGARSSVKLETDSQVDGIGNVNMKENLAVEVSSRRIYAVWDHNGENHVRFTSAFSTTGTQNSKITLEMSPWSMNLWDILKLDLTTSADKRQYLHGSVSIVYIKSQDGYSFPIYVNKLADGFTFTIPEIHLEAPGPILTTPGFKVPFTTLQVPSYTFDLRNIKIPQKLTTMPFNISLPSLLWMSFPKVDIGTDYITLEEYKIPYFEVTVPEYQITMSQFTLPKTFSLGNQIVDLNEVANKIANFDLPTITIPEQKIQIPPLKISLPAGIYIPAFGALTGSFGVASPLYNVTWKTGLKNNKDSFEYSLDSTSSSTLQFLEYDLDAVSTYRYEGEVFAVKTVSSFSHPDLSAEYKGDFTMRGIRVPDHSAVLNITSPTFINVQIGYNGTKNKISSLISSPSAGTLGSLFEMDDNLLKQKLYYRSQSAPHRDIDILKGEISFKKRDLIQIKINWKEDAAPNMLRGLKEKIPKITDAVYNCVNKYHKEYMGMDISAATSKAKILMQKNADKAYQVAVKQVDEIDLQLRAAASQATGKYQEMKAKTQQLYQKAADQAAQIDYQQISAKIFGITIDIIKEYHIKVKHLIDSFIEFLKTTKFQVPGLTEKHTGEELYAMSTEKAAKAIDQCILKLEEYFDALIVLISELEVKVPVSERVIKGRDVLEKIKEMLKVLQNQVRQVFTSLKGADFAEKLEKLKQFVQDVFQKVEEVIRNLQSKNFEDIKIQTQQLYRDAINSNYAKKLKSLAGDFKTCLYQVKDFNQKVFQELSEKLHQILTYMKALREEYFDPSIIGWSVKYYEVEEKVIEWLKSLIDTLTDWHGKFIEDIADMAAQLIDQGKDLGEKHARVYYDLLTDTDGKGKEKIRELSSAAQEKIQHWSAAVKKGAAEQHKQVKAKLLGAYDQLLLSCEWLITETRKLIDVAIESYSTVIRYITELLYKLEKSTAESIKAYIAIRPGELRIDLPKPFNWQSVSKFAQLSEEALRKKMELTRTLMQQGIEQGSKKWEELQIFIDQQLAVDQLSVQQIIENLQKRINT